MRVGPSESACRAKPPPAALIKDDGLRKARSLSELFYFVADRLLQVAFSANAVTWGMHSVGCLAILIVVHSANLGLALSAAETCVFGGSAALSTSFQ